MFPCTVVITGDQPLDSPMSLPNISDFAYCRNVIRFLKLVAAQIKKKSITRVFGMPSQVARRLDQVAMGQWSCEK